MSIEIEIGDVVKLKKPHPCGSYDWEVVRLGADIGLKCQKCHRRVLLQRSVFERRLKEKPQNVAQSGSPKSKKV